MLQKKKIGYMSKTKIYTCVGVVFQTSTVKQANMYC